ncbi:Exodeoxyribonuclease VII small subunit [Pseudobutyrivibrio sp. ACV-2]|nr:Exodeoxyribonuclease VII small subunit [Pseudobutyrivibrio sp. ACV-2]
MMSIGLSVAALMGQVSLTAYAEEIDTEENAPEHLEQVSVTNDETVADAETIADEACEAMDEAQEATQAAVSETETAVGTLESQEISAEDAQTVVENASNAVDSAEQELENAENKYNQLVSEYDKAKAEYENAALAYAVELQATQSSLEDAEGGLAEAEARLHQLEQEIAAARESIYEYTDADGQVLQLTAEEAEALNGQIAIDNYWTIDGTYVPRYIEYMRYTGVRDARVYNPISAVEDGKQYVEDEFKYNREYYKTSIEFNDDWETEKNPHKRTYETTGTFKASYNKTIEKNGYEVSDTIKESHYSSENEAVDAVIDEAKKLHGAATIDMEDSRLNPANVTLYSEIVEKYKYLVGDEADYNKLIADAELAKTQMKAAREKVRDIQNKLDNLKDDDSVLALVQVTYLESRLEAATASYNQAKENLIVANKNLQDAKDIYANKYQQAPEEKQPEASPSESTDAEIVPSEEDIPEEILPETEIDDKEKRDVIEKVPQKISSSGGNSDESWYEAAPVISLPKQVEVEETVEEPQEEIIDLLPFLNSDDTVSQDGGRHQDTVYQDSESLELQDDTAIEEPVLSSDETITIPDGATPKDITLSGLKQHRKWFVGLAGIAGTGGIGIGIFEARRRAIAKILDKLNQ